MIEWEQRERVSIEFMKEMLCIHNMDKSLTKKNHSLIYETNDKQQFVGGNVSFFHHFHMKNEVSHFDVIWISDLFPLLFTRGDFSSRGRWLC
jgi:hypothetical protein